MALDGLIITDLVSSSSLKIFSIYHLILHREKDCYTSPKPFPSPRPFLKARKHQPLSAQCVYPEAYGHTSPDP